MKLTVLATPSTTGLEVTAYCALAAGLYPDLGRSPYCSATKCCRGERGRTQPCVKLDENLDSFHEL